MLICLQIFAACTETEVRSDFKKIKGSQDGRRRICFGFHGVSEQPCATIYGKAYGCSLSPILNHTKPGSFFVVRMCYVQCHCVVFKDLA